MSQTETILLIALGFSLASLIALFAGRLVWTAAVKAGARRMQRQVPSSLVGLQTERDRLRAEYAILSQRLGAKLEEAQLRIAEQMAEVSRHRNRALAVEASQEGRKDELRQLAAQVRNLEHTLAAARTREEELRREVAKNDERLRRLFEMRSEEARSATPPPPADAAAEPPPPAEDDAETRLRRRIERLAELARATPPEAAETVIHAPPPPKEEEPSMADRLAEAEQRTRALEEELQRLDQQWQDPPAPEAEGGGDANVISLNKRLRALRQRIDAAPGS